MKRFVEKGGVLIADVKPGIADEHGKVGAQKTIPGLFGMKWADPLAPEVKRKVLFSGAYRGQSFSGKTPSEIGVDAGFALDGAEGLLRAGDTPVLIHRPSGQGTAICLNFPIYSQTDDLRNVLRVLLSAHGVASRARVQRFEEASSPGTWVPGFESSRFADGGAEYCGFTRHRTSAEVDSRAGRVDVVFNEPRHVHDLRTGEYLGCRQEVSADVTTSHARLLAALPYRVTGLRITLNRPQVDPGDIVQGAVEVLVDGAKAGRHVIHVSVERPDGQRVRYLTFPREAREGKAEFQIPLGRNEPTGRWTVFCTDVATQTRQQATFEVQAAP
jgi:hypothetical protein